MSMNEPDPNNQRELIVEIIKALHKLEQGAHMKSLIWLLIILTVTNVIIATVQVCLLVTTLHRPGG
jgi:uncharacterized Rmd1/YagE family protein